jgi:hypothetical protein
MPFIGSQPPQAALTSASISSGAVNSDQIATGAVDLAHMSTQSVDEDNLHISNAGSNGQFLSKQSGDAGGLTWAAAAQFANWTQSSGHLTPDNAAYGIHLGVATATASNLLDDYEEGTWTPVLGGYGGTSGQTYASNGQNGTYTKIGRWIHCVYTIGLSDKGTITSTLALQGLPFSGSSAAGFWDQGGAIPAYSDNITCTADHTLVGRIRLDQPDIVWQEVDWQADDPVGLTTSAVGSGTTYLYGSFSYHIQ